MSMRTRKQKFDKKLLDIEVGAPVIVTKDDGAKVATTVTSKPWRLGHGDWVIGLDGISGGYDLSRVRRAPASEVTATKTDLSPITASV